jgi:hypothetical protein
MIENNMTNIVNRLKFLSLIILDNLLLILGENQIPAIIPAINMSRLNKRLGYINVGQNSGDVFKK